MDVSTVYALAVAIYKLSMGIMDFVGQHQDKGALITNISDIARQIQKIVSPLLLPNHVTYDSVKEVLQALQKALAQTDRHLRAWKERPTLRFVAFVNRSAVTSELREDREQLVHQCLLLMVAMQVGDHMRQYQLLLPSAEDNTSTLPEYNEVAASRRSSESLANGPQSHSSILKPTLPLLIYINDNLEGNNRLATYAAKRGITVVQLDSTSAAKTWIRVNTDYLKKHDDPRNLRFISDQVRHEVNSEGVRCKNIKAGNDITKFIRDEGFKAPILIFTSEPAIELTRYVETYPNTGSMTRADYKVVNEYVEALGARRKGDTGWIKFGG